MLTAEKLREFDKILDRCIARKKRKSKAHESLENYKPRQTVRQFDGDGVPVGEFGTMAEAARETGISIHRITRCVHGYTKDTDGYTWKRGEH